MQNKKMLLESSSSQRIMRHGWEYGFWKQTNLGLNSNFYHFMTLTTVLKPPDPWCLVTKMEILPSTL